MSIIKEIGLGLLVLAILAGTAMIAVSIVTEHYRGEGIKPTPVENAAVKSEPGFWETHNLNAIPSLENATTEDLLTTEKVENILFKWDVFKNQRPPVVVNYTTKSFDEILYDVETWLNLEHHFDENGKLHVDTPGWVYETPSKRKDDKYLLANSIKENGGGPRNELDFVRHLKEQKIVNGLSIFKLTGSYPVGLATVPVENGLAHFLCCGCERAATCIDIWYATNPKPGEQYPFWSDYHQITEIDIYWRLGEGEYVEWNYVLENGEPTIVWPENGEPVDWMI